MSTTTQSHDQTMLKPSQTPRTTMAAVKSELTRALVVEMLGILLSAIGVFNMIGVTYAMATQDDFTGVNLYFGYLSDGGLVAWFVAATVLGVVVARRTWKMLDAANRGDLARLRSLTSVGWGVVAIFSSYVAPGIWLLRVNRSLDSTSDIVSGA